MKEFGNKVWLTISEFKNRRRKRRPTHLGLENLGSLLARHFKSNFELIYLI